MGTWWWIQLHHCFDKRQIPLFYQPAVIHTSDWDHEARITTSELTEVPMMARVREVCPTVVREPGITASQLSITAYRT